MQAQSFGDWLRRKRRSLDLTQAGLVGQVGCSGAAIRKIEAQERRSSAQIVERLAVIFNIPSTEQTAFMHFARGEMDAGMAGMQEGTPLGTSPRPHRSNSPAMLTSRVGRDKKLARVRKYLLTPDIRLVTLTVPPSIGKTRLSIEAARSVVPNLPAGVFFAALSSFDAAACWVKWHSRKRWSLVAP